MKHILLLFGLFVLSVGCRQTSNRVKVEKSVLVVPGQSIGPYKINQNATPALDSLEKPDKANAAMGKAVLSWSRVNGGKLSLFTTRKMGVEQFSRIKLIRTQSPHFQTAQGLGVGSDLATIKNRFNLKKVGHFTVQKIRYQLYVSTKGIGFEIAPDQSCSGIIVMDTPDDPVTYRPLYADFGPSF